MKEKNVPIIYALFLFSPFISTILALLCYLKNPKNIHNKIIMIFFMSLVALTIIPAPTSDLTRYYRVFHEIKDIPFKDLSNLMAKKSDAIVYYYFKLVSYFTNNHQWIGFFSAFFSYSILFGYISKLIEKNNIKKASFYAYIVLFFGMQSLYTWAGIRQPNAILCFILGVYFILNNKKIGYPFLVLASLFHASLYVPVLIFIISKFFKYKKRNFYISLLLVIIFYFLRGQIINIVNLIAPNIMSDGIEYKFARVMKYADRGGTLLIGRILLRTIFLFNMIIFYYFNLKIGALNKQIKDLSKFMALYYIFWSITTVAQTAMNRYMIIITYIIFYINIYFIEKRVAQKLKRKLLIIYLIFGILSWLNNIVFDLPSYNPKLVVSNLYQVINIKVEPWEYNIPQNFYDFLRALAGSKKN